MNPLASSFYKSHTLLTKACGLSWEGILEQTPDLPRSWFELSRISAEERVEFVRDYWLEALSFHPAVHPKLEEFFSELDDIGIALPPAGEEGMPEMIYSFADNRTFFRGSPPACEEDVRRFSLAIGAPLPRDYLRFFLIHNGFGKLSEWGLLSIEKVFEARKEVEDLILHVASHPVQLFGHLLDERDFIPFYEVSGMGSFQCFCTEWYPGSEMGNIYLSGIDGTISDIRERATWSENLAFATFGEWLACYLGGMNLFL